MYKLIKLSFFLIILDAIWIYFIMLKKFNHQIEIIQNAPLQLNIYAAIIAYIFIISLLYIFIIKEKKSIKDAFLLGLCTYGIYEFTNKSIIKNWTFETAILDTLWGGVLFALSTYLMKHY